MKLAIALISRTLIAVVILCILCASVSSAKPSASPALDVRIVTDEADAVLAILMKKKAGRAITEADWQRLFATEGYIRLRQRETSMKRSFEDSDFKTFVLSNELSERAQSLAETLNKWKRADITGAARRALAYLPREAHIACMCDQRKLLLTYNKAAREYNRTASEPIAIWSSSLIEATGKAEGTR